MGKSGPARNRNTVLAPREALADPRFVEHRVPAARHDREPREVEDPVRLAPGREAGERLGREDEPGLVGSGARRPDRAQGVDRVRRPGTVDLQARAREAGVARDRRLDHRDTVLGGRDRPPWLVRRRGGGHEDHPLETERLPRLLGDDQVAVVDRVERAAEDPDGARHDALPAGSRPRRCRTPIARRTGCRNPVAGRVRASVTSPPRAGSTRARWRLRGPCPRSGCQPSAVRRRSPSGRARAGTARPTPRCRSSSGRRDARCACR